MRGRGIATRSTAQATAQECVPAPVICIVGWKNSGKTTLVTRLVAHFTAGGLKIATIKNAHHSFRIDGEGTDSARHRQAGACETVIFSDRRIARIREYKAGHTLSLDDIVGTIMPCDLVIAEGFKRACRMKVEVRLALNEGAQRPLLCQDDEHIIAIALARPPAPGTAHTAITGRAAGTAGARTGPALFDRDDIAAIADEIARTLNIKWPR